MGYQVPLRVVTRKLSPNVLAVSCPFSILDKLNVGARMVIFHFDGDVLIWSPIPYNKEIFERAVAELTTEPYTVKYIFIINVEHNLAGESYREGYPDVKLIGSEATQRCHIDIPLTNENAMLVIKGDGWGELGVDDKSVTQNLELIYNSYHKNKELLVYDNSTKTLFLADFIFNLGIHGTTEGTYVLEQYSPQLGFDNLFNPHAGWSFFTRYLQPKSLVGQYLMNRLQRTKHHPEKTKEIIALINEWDYERIVMVHGDDITSDAKETLSGIYL
ncbi:hypothetical protein Cantr_00581 [Candida viswanathii]|uniref:Metallo-beta-lactamase domain-containing protein n=1 Tax=Candida viswanathii TaxID=5486 RepID=A0A367YJC9_9ASCO|nr:hypothetical protein Cantr_00581 [Candida viswanathii]